MKQILPLLFIVTATACGLTGVDRVTANIQGTVVAEATGLPLAGVRVELVDPTFASDDSDEILGTTSTDSQGRYSLTAAVKENCDIGPFFGLYVGASAPGFTGSIQSLEQCEGSFQFDFSLEASP